MEREEIRELAHFMIMPQYGKKGCSSFFQLALRITYQRAQDYVGKMEEIGGEIDQRFKKRKVASFEELLQACISLEVKFMVCEMGLKAIALNDKPLRGDVPVEAGGIVTFFNDAFENGQIIFI